VGVTPGFKSLQKEIPMRRFTVALGVLILCGGFIGRVQAQDEPRAIIEKAIKANGGAELLEKRKASQTKSKGTLEVMGQNLSFTQEVTGLLPDKAKEVLHLDIMGMNIDLVTVMNGDNLRITAAGNEVPISDAIKQAVKEQKHMAEVIRLLPLLKDKSYELSPVGEVQVAGKPAVGVRVSKMGCKDVSLFFDKSSGLMAKVEHRATDANSGQEVAEERIILEYQQVAGAPAPKRAVLNRDGKKFMELEVLEVKYPDTIDENEFK
jgi:hypothetical protein